MNAIKFPKLRPYLILAAATLALAGSLSAQASLIMFAGTGSASAGSTGNTFDFTLTNTGPSAITLGAFSLGISVADTHVSFTSATTATSLTYVFAGDSLFGPVISTSGPGQILVASDLCLVCGSSIAAGATVGLAHIFFNVSAGAPSGPLTVSVTAFPFTSLSDLAGNPLAAILQNGTITITGGGTVPEPSTLALLALPMVFLARRRFRSRDAA
jgi:anaerobic selenocysteine-containing dehydrogenase